MVGRTEEVCAIFAELRVTKGEKFEVPISDSNSVVKSSVDASKKFVISLLVGTGEDFPLRIVNMVVDQRNKALTSASSSVNCTRRNLPSLFSLA